jgi:DNA-binding response OmpR family regulator
MNILIIEDDKLTLTSLQYLTESLGHKVQKATSAEEAINLAADGKFDLIICDIMMPGISGLSFVSILRTIHLCTTPVIMISSLTDQSIMDALLEAGANDFMAKPFSPEELEQKINKFNKSIA